MTEPITKTVFILLLITALAFAAGCDKSDDDDDSGSGDDDDDDAFVATSITFTPDGPGAAGDIWVELESVNTEENTFVLKVVGDHVLSAYGVAGRMEFDTDMTTLNEARPGNALLSDDAQVMAKGAGNDAGAVFGISRTGDFVHGVVIEKTKIIGTLEFTVSAAGTTQISFHQDSSRVMSQDLEVVEVGQWLGGKLVVE